RDPAGRGAPAAARGAPRVQRGRGPVPGRHLGALLVRGVTLAEFVVATPRSRGRPLANRRQDGRDRWGGVGGGGVVTASPPQPHAPTMNPIRNATRIFMAAPFLRR